MWLAFLWTDLVLVNPCWPPMTDIWFLVHMTPPEIVPALCSCRGAREEPLKDLHPEMSWWVIMKCDTEENFFCSEDVSCVVRRSPREAPSGCESRAVESRRASQMTWTQTLPFSVSICVTSAKSLAFLSCKREKRCLPHGAVCTRRKWNNACPVPVTDSTLVQCYYFSRTNCIHQTTKSRAFIFWPMYGSPHLPYSVEQPPLLFFIMKWKTNQVSGNSIMKFFW